MDSDKRIKKEDIYQILERNISWIENCDTKTSVILGVIGVMVAIFLSSDYLIEITGIFDAMLLKGAEGMIYIVSGVVALLTIIRGIFYLVLVLLAKTSTKEFDEKGLKNDSVIFFSSIAQNKAFNDYRMKVESCSETELQEDLISQIYICSRICTAKFNNYKKGLTLSMIGLVSFSIILLIGAVCV